MGLEAFERALARLATEDPLRERFVAAPAETAAELGLAPDEAARLAALDPRRVELFAEQLRLKRYGEVRRALPRALAALGEEVLRARFLEFARGFVPEGVHKHRADALAFAGFLVERLDGAAREAAHLDRAALGLFHRLDGRAARPRAGPAVATSRLDGRRVLLVRGRGAARYRVVRLAR